MSHLWQQPFVNIFKHFNIQSWKKCSKEGEVAAIMDKNLKSTVYRITGAIPAGNYIQLPKTSTQSLGLTGRHLYLLFRPMASKYFVVHVDVATIDGLVIRISFSNLFKEFKSTSTWLQFPFVCHASKSSVAGLASQTNKGRETVGCAPVSTQWTVLCLDLQDTLNNYLNRQYSYVKSVKLCANMTIKNLFTSDTYYVPGITLDQMRRSGITLEGASPMPREMSFPLGKTEIWNDLYDFIRFPADGVNKPFDTIQLNRSQSDEQGTIVRKAESRTVHATTSGSTAALYHQTKPPYASKRQVTMNLPQVGVDEHGEVCVYQQSEGDVHVYASGVDEILVHQENAKTGRVISSKVTGPTVLPPVKENYKCLKPDPILKLKRIVGFGGGTTRNILWNHTGSVVVYPCHAVVIAMQASNGQQRFFIGHTDKVSCIAMNGATTLLASGQTGPQSVVRVWRFQTAECLAMFKTHAHSLTCLSMSNTGGSLCGVGKDSHGKNMVVVWNLEQVNKGGQVSVTVKAHTDVDIISMKVAAFDHTRMVSCGRDNIRLWRVKDGNLRSAPVNLGEYHSLELTDCCFEAGYEPTKDPLDRIVYACSRSGHVFEIDYRKVAIRHVRRLQPVRGKDRTGFNSGAGIALNCICVNEAFCVTGSDDGFIRLWPLDFSHVYLEAEHDGPVTAADISPDGLQLLAGTCTGNVGILDVSSRAYTTIMRSHVGRILSMSLDSNRKHVATVSEDHTIRIWDLDTMQQMYDFTAPKECPCAIAYHPHQHIFACGFESGAVRIFSIATTSMIAEHKQHRGKVVGLAFNPSANFLYSAGSLGSIALHDTSADRYQLLRLLGNTVAIGEKHAPDALAVSQDGRLVAFVGPTEFTISVVNGQSLDELMRIDITSLNTVDNSRTIIDSAVKVKYAPTSVRQLLVTTSSNKLLKFDAKTGKILAEIDNIHRSGCTSLDVSADSRHLVTAGDKVIKVWDYHMRLDLNFQVFIGHSDSVSCVSVTPDSSELLSVGEAIFIWDFLANAKKPQVIQEGRTRVKNYYTGDEEELSFYKNSKNEALNNDDSIRKSAPVPISYPPGHHVADISFIDKEPPDEELLGEEVVSKESSDDDDVDNDAARLSNLQIKDGGTTLEAPDDEKRGGSHGNNSYVQRETGIRGTPTKKTSSSAFTPKKNDLTKQQKPTVNKHFFQRQKKCSLAQRRYVAPPSQAGLKLKSVIGYNGNGRGNMIWHSDSGLFAYSSGSVIVVEDLKAASQRHLLGHNEEISTLALQHDFQFLASASGSHGLSATQICVWDLQQMTCRQTLSYHDHDVVCLAYSRDDRFLISVGDYRDCTIVVWSTVTYQAITSTKTSTPTNDLKWDPYTVNEFASVGESGTVLFWLLDETRTEASLNLHEADSPEDLLATHHIGSGRLSFTCLEYAGDSVLFIGTSNGRVSAWDTRKNTCFMHWEADSHEIDVLVSRRGRLVTGSSGHSLRLWSVVGVGEMKLPGEINMMRTQGLTMEDEMNFDGLLTAASFDETMDMGIVGTSSGTLWYVNWVERASIRLVSGHGAQINSILTFGEDYLLTSCQDGSVRLWSINNREQTLQFQVINQSCNCIALAPVPRCPSRTVTTVSNLDSRAPVVAHTKPNSATVQFPSLVGGYSDGTVRMFDLNRVEMVLKMHPHAVSVTAVAFSSDGRMILSGSDDGLVAISSPTTGITVRVINDHKGAPITCLDVTLIQDQDDSGVAAPQLWLAASADRRVSVWSADWSKDFCELVDWLTFPAPAFDPEGIKLDDGDRKSYKRLPPCIARFSKEELDVVVYVGYGMQKQVQFYSLAQRKVLRTTPLTHWASTLDLSPSSSLIAVGNDERLLKLVDYYEGSFQDFVGHSDSVTLVKFSSTGKLLFSISHSEILLWTVSV